MFFNAATPATMSGELRGRRVLDGLLEAFELGRFGTGAAVDDRADRGELEVQRRDDPEVAAAAADAPEQVGVLVGRRGHDAPVGGDNFSRHEVVAREPELALEEMREAAKRFEFEKAAKLRDRVKELKTKEFLFG